MIEVSNERFAARLQVRWRLPSVCTGASTVEVRRYRTKHFWRTVWVLELFGHWPVRGWPSDANTVFMQNIAIWLMQIFRKIWKLIKSQVLEELINSECCEWRWLELTEVASAQWSGQVENALRDRHMRSPQPVYRKRTMKWSVGSGQTKTL